MRKRNFDNPFCCRFIILLALCFSITCFAGKQKNKDSVYSKKNCVISCIITHQPADGEVILKKMNFQNGEFILVGKFKYSRNQTFTYEGDFREPNFYLVNLFNKYSFELILLPGQNVFVSIDLMNPNNMIIKGSDETTNLYKIDSIYKTIRDGSINPTIKELLKAQKEKNSERIIQLTKSYYNQNQSLKNELKSQMKSFSIPVIVYSVVKYFDFDEDFSFLDSLASNFKLNHADLSLVNYFVKQVNNARNVTIGAKVNNIALSNPKGTIIPLYSLKDKYILLNFWASWNKQCREINLELKNIYLKYKTKGFEIYSISLDENKQKWIDAIEKDKIAWTEVSDLKGFDTDIAKYFNISKFPFNLLLDKEGRIIAKNIRGYNLEQKLASLLK